MTLRKLLWGSALAVAMMLPAIPAPAATVTGCAAAKPTALSNTWNFKHEADNIFAGVAFDAQQISDHAETLRNFATDSNISWPDDADQLNTVKDNIDDIGAKLCRLETIRSMVAPWQQRIVDQIVTSTRLMADNAQDAITFADHNQQDLWTPAYQDRVNTLLNEATSLKRTVHNAVQYAHVSKEYRDLHRNL
jgi:hypothetical protein